MRLKIYTLALIPVILFQGYAVKKNTPRLAEPEGERIGQKGVCHKAASVLRSKPAAK